MTQKQDIIGNTRRFLARLERDEAQDHQFEWLENGESFQLSSSHLAQALLIAVEALENADMIYKRNGEGSNEFFERMADHFYRETGLMAPGKDDILGTPMDARRKAFDQWVDTKRISTALSRLHSLPNP